jgi:hypothetical protein
VWHQSISVIVDKNIVAEILMLEQYLHWFDANFDVILLKHSFYQQEGSIY